MGAAAILLPAPDSLDFFGRDALTADLVAHVADHTFTAVVGASGSGKSSVVRAGLLPALADGALPGSQDWLVVTMMPQAPTRSRS